MESLKPIKPYEHPKFAKKMFFGRHQEPPIPAEHYTEDYSSLAKSGGLLKEKGKLEQYQITTRLKKLLANGKEKYHIMGYDKFVAERYKML